MGNYTSLSNKILMDVARSHVLLVAGKRGSGKSYTLGVIAEELSNLPKEVSQNIASLIFDTMGIYWTMKYQNEKDKELLSTWNLQPKNLPIKIFVPFGFYDTYLEQGIPVAYVTPLKSTGRENSHFFCSLHHTIIYGFILQGWPYSFQHGFLLIGSPCGLDFS